VRLADDVQEKTHLSYKDDTVHWMEKNRDEKGGREKRTTAFRRHGFIPEKCNHRTAGGKSRSCQPLHRSGLTAPTRPHH
jgi:hypothetical protein